MWTQWPINGQCWYHHFFFFLFHYRLGTKVGNFDNTSFIYLKIQITKVDIKQKSTLAIQTTQLFGLCQISLKTTNYHYLLYAPNTFFLCVCLFFFFFKDSFPIFPWNNKCDHSDHTCQAPRRMKKTQRTKLVHYILGVGEKINRFSKKNRLLAMLYGQDTNDKLWFIMWFYHPY